MFATISSHPSPRRTTVFEFQFFPGAHLESFTVTSARKIANVNGVTVTLASQRLLQRGAAPRLRLFGCCLGRLSGRFRCQLLPWELHSNTDLKNVPFLSNFQPNCQSAVAIQIKRTGSAPATVLAMVNAPRVTVRSIRGCPFPRHRMSQPAEPQPALFQHGEPNFKAAVIDQYNLQVEQQFGPTYLYRIRG